MEELIIVFAKSTIKEGIKKWFKKDEIVPVLKKIVVKALVIYIVKQVQIENELIETLTSAFTIGFILSNMAKFGKL